MIIVQVVVALPACLNINLSGEPLQLNTLDGFTHKKGLDVLSYHFSISSYNFKWFLPTICPLSTLLTLDSLGARGSLTFVWQINKSASTAQHLMPLPRKKTEMFSTIISLSHHAIFKRFILTIRPLFTLLALLPLSARRSLTFVWQVNKSLSKAQNTTFSHQRKSRILTITTSLLNSTISKCFDP